MTAARPEYQAFPDRAHRNVAQRRLEVPLLVAALGLPRGGRVLEVGCGRGVALSVLEERLRPARLVGLDLDASLLAEAGRSWSGTGARELLCADVRSMPLPPGSIDLVFDFGTLFHIASPELAAAEIARVLAPGGLFVHETWISQLLSHPTRLARRRVRVPWSGTPELRPYRSAALWAAHERIAAREGGWAAPQEGGGAARVEL